MTALSQPRRLRRSVLVFPATMQRMAQKAAGSAADCVVFDLEDSVPHDAKPLARVALKEALQNIDFGSKEICVRINAVTSPNFSEDMRAVRGLPIHSVVVPKVESATDVQTVDAALAGHGDAVRLHLAIETPSGMFACRDFAQASPRVDALIFGAGDFVAASGFSSEEVALIHPRSHISLAASSLGIDALDMVFVDLADPEGLADSAAAGRALGYDGKWVIHPGQVAVVNKSFDPTVAEIARARRILDRLADEARQGRGATTLDGSLIDEASIRWAEAVVSRSPAVGE
jgi:malyl-CoA/(S)-citramalyl-CoA lyase